jgi:signal transduction histidine kinase
MRILNNIRNAAMRMNALIDDFLSLQVLQGQPGERLVKPFNLPRLVSQVLEQNLFSATAKQITIAPFLPPPGLPDAIGDSARTHQILSNYISNAIKYTPPGREVGVNVLQRDSRLRVEVRDDGPGVQPSDRSKLFVEFAKIGNKPTGGESSTGLGLAIVKHLAERQGGTVGADFPGERGSVFWFEIPIAPGTSK